MQTKMTISTGFAAALLAFAAMQFPGAALALNPQPEVPSKPVDEATPPPPCLVCETARYKARLLVTPALPPSPIRAKPVDGRN
jgi:hypothetical protein